MPNWTDDEGRCHFKVRGVPCYESAMKCPAHRLLKPRRSKAVEEAFKRGAEAMREAAADHVESKDGRDRWHYASRIRALPVPEDKS